MDQTLLNEKDCLNLISIVEATLKVIAERVYKGYYTPVCTPLLDLYMWSEFPNELRACGFEPTLFHYKSMEEELVKLIESGSIAMFDMNWVRNVEDPKDGYYELQISNNI